MNVKNILTLMGAILGLQSLALFFGGETIAKEAFAALNPDETGIAIGALMHEVVGVINLMVAVILLSARNIEPSAGAKVLFGASIGLAITLSHGYFNLFTTETKPPVPLLVLMTILMILGFVTAKKQSEA